MIFDVIIDTQSQFKKSNIFLAWILNIFSEVVPY